MTFYKISLSNKLDVEIDEEDFTKLKANIESGKLIQLKQAVINPSFIVGITPIKKEKEEKIEGYIDQERRVFVKTSDTLEDPKLADEFSSGVKKLADGMSYKP